MCSVIIVIINVLFLFDFLVVFTYFLLSNLVICHFPPTSQFFL